MMPPTMTIAGSAVDSSETARPWMTLVPWPVTEAWAIEIDRALAGAGVVFGDPHDQAGDDEADDAADEQVLAGDRHAGDGADLAPADQVVRWRRARPTIDSTPVDDQALVERAHDRAVGAELDEEGADDRGQDAGAADAERIEHRGGEDRLADEEDRGEHHGGDDGHRIGLEQVGGHAGAVADIVADVVGDGRRVARIVFGNAGLDLADEIAADVGALGEDAAAETGEDRDQRGAEAERDQRVDDGAVVRAAGPADRSG